MLNDIKVQHINICIKGYLENSKIETRLVMNKHTYKILAKENETRGSTNNTTHLKNILGKTIKT